jgi:hypothetical protein
MLPIGFVPAKSQLRLSFLAGGNEWERASAWRRGWSYCRQSATAKQERAIAPCQDQDGQDRCGCAGKVTCQALSARDLDGDEATETLRRLMAQRSQIVQQMTHIKNRIHGVLHSNLIPPYDGELLSASGRVWLGSPPLSGMKCSRSGAIAPTLISGWQTSQSLTRCWPSMPCVMSGCAGI